MTPNPKIQALIKSMGIIPEDEHYDVAEAVIREVADRMEHLANNDYNDDRGAMVALLYEARQLKKHFGIG